MSTSQNSKHQNLLSEYVSFYPAASGDPLNYTNGTIFVADGDQVASGVGFVKLKSLFHFENPAESSSTNVALYDYGRKNAQMSNY